MPCISTVCPWEAWYFGRGAKPEDPRPSSARTTSRSASSEFYKALHGLWPQVPTNKKIGVMWPNDADGNAIRACARSRCW